ncbi:MAG TPA: energy-coupling factor ABC transporter permease [Coriobacteriia bacterium]|nr:energy-coupling factor ABC transporter permease [Coriobacteriia bacterium]
MHIPDGMLSTPVAAASGMASAGFVGYAVSWTKRHLSEQRTVLMSVMSALVFALQMLNFPIAPGISGHFAGGAAVAILLGPWPAVIVMTTVLLVQAFLFADGGIVALGANVLNLAVIGPFVGFLVWRVLSPLRGRAAGRSLAAFVAAWSAVVLSACAVAAEVWLSGRAPLVTALVALGGWHALVGIGEGLITAGLVTFVCRVRPDVLEKGSTDAGTRPVVIAVMLLALAAVGVSWIASSNPDALEFVAATSGFEGAGEAIASPLADYVAPGVSNDALAGVLAGILGIAVTAVVVLASTRALGRRRDAAHQAELHRHSHEHPEEPAHEHPHHHPEDGHQHGHPLGFERFTYVLSPIHALDPRAKIVATMLFVLGAVLSPPARPIEFALAIALLLGVGLAARLPLGPVFARSAWVLLPAATLALYAPFTNDGWPLAWAILTKAWLSAMAVILLAATTSPPKLLLGLRSLGMPTVFIETLTFLYRFVSVLRDQVVSMRRATASRGYGLNRWALVRLYGNLAGSLFLRTYERGERIHAAMMSRGYAGSLPTAEVLRLTAADTILVVLAVIAATAIVLY